MRAAARDLTRCAFKTDKSSLKSGCIGNRASHRIVFLGEFGDRSDPLMDRTALPVAVLVRFHIIKVGVLADRFVHTLFTAQQRGLRSGTMLAERVRFELTKPFGSPVFKTGAINHSATSP